ncbi:MAG: FAD-dependent oxidoreductase [Phycisphaerales bacterium]|nr:FAD-dependent oxidoreductase [Phycisphaerales bacterium]
MAQKSQPLQTTCCIAGGGPAGMMLGYLLARAGVEVVVLEKHRDFFRDFRGDTIHPSTLELMNRLHLLDELLALPHQQLRQITAHFGGRTVHIADFSRLRTHSKFIAFMPQWDFLNFLERKAKQIPTFHLHMESQATDLIWDAGRVVGVIATTPAGQVEVRADLVVGADGRGSTVRQSAGLEVIDTGAPIDVLWFRLTKHPDDPPQAFGFVGAGQFMVLINRDEYWQCAYVIRKGAFEAKQQAGLDAFRDEIARCVPFLKGRTDEIRQWDQVKLLTVKVDHLRRWHRPGLLCIGDAAQAMSPVGGVGINLAIQDAVATARILAPRLLHHNLRSSDLQRVQTRRQFPARLTQRVQVFLHRHLLEPIFDSPTLIPPPLPMKLAEHCPPLRRLLANLIGVGIRPEYIPPKFPL